MKLSDLDQKDRKILYELDRDARQTYLQIAKKVHLNKDVVIYRINNLVKKNIIAGFHAVIDTMKLGYFIARVYVRLQNATLKKKEEIFSNLVREKNALWVAEVEGPWNCVFGLWVTSHQELDTIWQRFEQKYRSYIQKSEIAFFVEYSTYSRNYLLTTSSKRDVLIMRESQRIDIDDIDQNILHMLGSNARMSLVEMSTQLKLTSKAVSYRVKQLEKKGIILGYKANLNLNSISYHHYKVDLYLENFDKKSLLREFISSHPSVVLSERTIGGSDFEFDVECQSFEEFLKIMDELQEQLGDVIRDYQYYTSSKIHKVLYFPV